ncbi:Cytidylate kinase [Planctomycetes bacterium K23_9]|uniref:Cytidylate kinase n=1 Tax=Stieleria marina TaxID=1930275 RepID=A0A517NSZ0_9BACT|nr:Cytidylate kinase [Planctomycetes bacterium K23_9]
MFDRFLINRVRVENCVLIITIDGPAGAGKSSIAHQVADRLGFDFLDTGAMYRAVTYGALSSDIQMDDADSLSRFAAQIQLRWCDQKILLNGIDVSDKIRTPDVTKAIRFLADIPAVRDQLSQHMRRIADDHDIVTEGRDQGTEVFPNAQCKVFLTATPEERARRRQQQLADAGQTLSVEEILLAQNQRDLEDRMRAVGRLRAASDAVVIQSDGLTPDEVLEKVLATVEVCIERQRSNVSD